MKDRVFIDPPEPKKLRIRDFYHLEWILISIGIVSVSTILQYIQDPATLTTIINLSIRALPIPHYVFSVHSSIPNENYLNYNLYTTYSQSTNDCTF